jgi:cytochrome oxidase assembly protein ShyY1
VYRFLLTRRWLGYAALTVLLATVMVLLGFWQLDRYHQRSAVNARINASATVEPAPIERVLTDPPANGTGHRVGAAPPANAAWTRVTVTGRYDKAHEILVRNRTVEGAVGFEVVTPLVRDDGTAVLVDRGWVPPAPGGAIAMPDVPPAPDGTVRVIGRIHLPESRAGRMERVDGVLATRRIAPVEIADVVPYPLLGAYVTMQQQDPPADRRFTEVQPEQENALQNGGYVLQWWTFAAMTFFGFGLLARKEARGPDDDRDRDLVEATPG